MASQSLLKVNTDGSQQTYTGKTTSTGASDSGEFIVAGPSGTIDPSFFPNGFGPDVTTFVAGEALTAGNFVYINATGQVLKADAALPAKAARGYVLSNVANAANATVYFDEANTAVTGLTPGATYYLSTTPGGVTTTPPATNGSGQIIQELGFASSATNIHVNIQEPIIR
jgi:hypothetical protein